MQSWTIAVPSDLAPEQNCLTLSGSCIAWIEVFGSLYQALLDGGNATGYLMRSMVPKYATEFDKYIGVGFTHEDLNAHNVMINDDFNLTG